MLAPFVRGTLLFSLCVVAGCTPATPTCEGALCGDAGSRPSCAWCQPGTWACRDGSIARCVVAEQCAVYADEQACPEGSCSLGECRAQCVDECAAGELRCAGPTAVQRCGQADGDACLDWLVEGSCRSGETCSLGLCRTTCESECSLGSSRCQDNGIARCIDSDNNGCAEWGPTEACTSGDVCSSAGGIPVCESASFCRDECDQHLCAPSQRLNTHRVCGNFDFDPCRELSPGLSCVATGCQVAECDAARGCSFRDGDCSLDASLSDGSLSDAGLSDASLSDASLSDASLSDASLSDASLSDASLSDASLSDASSTCQGEGSLCDDGDSCTIADICSGHVCSGTPMDCTSAPSPTCEGGIARSYAASGSCVEGICNYAVASEETCSHGCLENDCAGPPGATSVAVGWNHACALLSDESVRCWGAGSLGQLGDGSAAMSSSPKNVAGLTGVTSISAGGNHTCAIRSDNTLHCWGYGAAGRLGVGDNDNRVTPVFALDSVSSVSAGMDHTCVVRTDNTVWCWGSNEYGKVGIASPSPVMRPVRVASLPQARAVAAGAHHTCAVLLDGSAWCWGQGNRGRLGNGSSADSATPVQVTGVYAAVAIATGNEHSCALLSNGYVRCWGEGNSGQLGFGGTSYYTEAVAAMVADVVSIDTGGDYTCVRLLDDSPRCWGRNTEGGLGTGDLNGRPVAVPVQELPQVFAIEAGYDHTCAVVPDGGVRCWGVGSAGKLGNGQTANQSAPVVVVDIP